KNPICIAIIIIYMCFHTVVFSNFLSGVSAYLKKETMILTALAAWGVYIAFLLFKYAETPDKKFENTPVWKHMYFMLMAMQIGFCVTYLI
ncbi:MAG: hypothetical protein KJ886_01475, partial [Candidatus Thermoplasmatota archaeon]|nr:hypothetical protein [Candidatus Thermoplasmatota archaeon]